MFQIIRNFQQEGIEVT